MISPFEYGISAISFLEVFFHKPKTFSLLNRVFQLCHLEILRVFVASDI